VQSFYTLIQLDPIFISSSGDKNLRITTDKKSYQKKVMQNIVLSGYYLSLTAGRKGAGRRQLSV
jgi:hypothetical protein